jgi:hypothetical protein
MIISRNGEVHLARGVIGRDLLKDEFEKRIYTLRKEPIGDKTYFDR